MFELTEMEKNEVVENFDRLLAIKYLPMLPRAFTEKGLYMIATILKGKRAIQTTFTIIEAFFRIRELSRTIAAMSKSHEESQQKSLMKKRCDLIADLLGEDMVKPYSTAFFPPNCKSHLDFV